MIYTSPSVHLDPHHFHPHFLMKYVRIGWGGCHGDHRAYWDQACRLPSGPFHSRGLSVKAENLPLKLCKLSGVSPYPKLSPPPPTLSPFRAPHLHPPYPPMCSPPLPLFLLSSSDPPLEIRCPLSPKVIPISPLISVSSYAIQKLNFGGKKEWHRKSLVSLLQTK